MSHKLKLLLHNAPELVFHEIAPPARSQANGRVSDFQQGSMKTIVSWPQHITQATYVIPSVSNLLEIVMAQKRDLAKCSESGLTELAACFSGDNHNSNDPVLNGQPFRKKATINFAALGVGEWTAFGRPARWICHHCHEVWISVRSQPRKSNWPRPEGYQQLAVLLVQEKSMDFFRDGSFPRGHYCTRKLRQPEQ